MRIAYPVVLSAMLLPCLALAQTQPMTSPATPMSSSMSPTTSSLNMQDKSFVKEAAQAGLAEISQGQLAQSNGDAAVQKLGAQMVTDHTAANDKLKTLATKLGVPVPTEPMAKDAMMTEKLKDLHGASFDTKYLHGQKLAHEKAIALFKLEIAAGGDPQLKLFAQQTLPVLEGHLKMIEQTQTSPMGA